LNTPRVTIAIPLYRSERFVERIVANVAAIDDPEAEIVISDRHGADGAIDRLRMRLGGDARVAFRAASDRCGWIDHYNDLLRRSAGSYFMWMPHDDEFPAGYVSRLTQVLDSEPGTLLAYGQLEAVDLLGRRAAVGAVAHDLARPWSQRSAGQLLLSWQSALPFRGVFRRQPVVDAGLWLPNVPAADQCWLFGLLLLGAIRFDPAVTCRKTRSPGSVTAITPRRLSDMFRAARVMRGLVERFVADRETARWLKAVTWRWCLWSSALETGARAAATLGLPPNARSRVRRALQGVAR
jgi:hypothetical protein